VSWGEVEEDGREEKMYKENVEVDNGPEIGGKLS
jgi:hypothetical protein